MHYGLVMECDYRYGHSQEEAMSHAPAAAFALCVLQVAMPSTVGSAEIVDGIYRTVPDGKGTRVTLSSGGMVDLGERMSENFGDITIWSLSNQNDRFRVLMKRAGPFDARNRAAIYVDGVCQVVNSCSEPDDSGKLEVIADVVGLANAKTVAVGLKAKLQERKHPGHQLLFSWKSVQESYKIGETVTLELEIENVGSTIVRFIEGGQQRGPRDNQFGFTAFAGSGYGKPLSDTGNPTNHGGVGAFRELKPNDVFRKQVDLSKWFKFEKPDTYRITGIYELELHDKDFGARVLWNDFAIGRCLVRIGK